MAISSINDDTTAVTQCYYQRQTLPITIVSRYINRNNDNYLGVLDDSESLD